MRTSQRMWCCNLIAFPAQGLRSEATIRRGHWSCDVVHGTKRTGRVSTNLVPEVGVVGGLRSNTAFLETVLILPLAGQSLSTSLGHYVTLYLSPQVRWVSSRGRGNTEKQKCFWMSTLKSRIIGPYEVRDMCKCHCSLAASRQTGFSAIGAAGGILEAQAYAKGMGGAGIPKER